MNWLLLPLIAGIAILISSISFSSHRYDGPKSDHFDGKRFYNPSGGHPKPFGDLLKWKLNGKKKDWPDWVENKTKLDLPKQLASNELAMTFVNHATVLLQTKNFNLLTDPVWAKRASPFSWIGPKRHRAPGIPFEKLPKIDFVLVSHNHYDHLDIETLKKLDDRFSPRFFVALGDKKLLTDNGIKNVTEMDWWQTVNLNGNTALTFVPSKHWSARGLFDRLSSLWGGFYLKKENLSAYYSGDTGYTHDFQEIRQRLGSPDISLLPIGAYAPRWFMEDYHMNPEDAVLAHLDLSSKKSMAVHYGTFQLTDEGIDDPVHDLMEARRKHNLSENDFFVLNEGETRIIRNEN